MTSWSYSSLSLFKQCPRKFHRLRVLKDIKEPDSEHLIYGRDVHTAAEEYGRDGKELPAKYAYIPPSIDAVLANDREQHFERRLALTETLEPTDFFADNVWWRGIADFISIEGDKAWLVDWKTGKSARYADTKQLEILSLAMFRVWQGINTIYGGLAFLVSKEFVPARFRRHNADSLWEKWFLDTERLKAAEDTGVWNASPNFTCRAWCPVLDCEHNGRH